MIAVEADRGQRARRSGEEAAPVAEEKKSEDSLDMGDDLFDLFTDEDEIDEGLLLLAASLDGVDINDLLEQVRDLQDIMDGRLTT
jgi:ribosomal protein L12E/L44/L45/RPP1/RPP2